MINKKYAFISVAFALITLNIFCSEYKIKNNKIAFAIFKGNKIYLILTGKRVPLVHDPISILKNKLIDDTLFLQIPTLKNGIINGNEIPVEEYYNTYKGYILINNKKIIVALQIVDIDSKKIIVEPYNGAYDLQILK